MGYGDGAFMAEMGGAFMARLKLSVLSDYILVELQLYMPHGPPHVDHWHLKPWIQSLATANFFSFTFFNFASYHQIYIQPEASCIGYTQCFLGRAESHIILT